METDWSQAAFAAACSRLEKCYCHAFGLTQWRQIKRIYYGRLHWSGAIPSAADSALAAAGIGKNIPQGRLSSAASTHIISSGTSGPCFVI